MVSFRMVENMIRMRPVDVSEVARLCDGNFHKDPRVEKTLMLQTFTCAGSSSRTRGHGPAISGGDTGNVGHTNLAPAANQSRQCLFPASKKSHQVFSPQQFEERVDIAGVRTHANIPIFPARCPPKNRCKTAHVEIAQGA